MKIRELLVEAKKSYENMKYDDAVLYLETVLEMDENNYEALVLLVRIYSGAGFSRWLFDIVKKPINIILKTH